MEDFLNEPRLLKEVVNLDEKTESKKPRRVLSGKDRKSAKANVDGCN